MTPEQKDLINKIWAYSEKELKDRFEYLSLKRMKIYRYISSNDEDDLVSRILNSKKILVFNIGLSEEEIKELETIGTLMNINNTSGRYYARMLISICASNDNKYITKEIKDNLIFMNSPKDIIVEVLSLYSDELITSYGINRPLVPYDPNNPY